MIPPGNRVWRVHGMSIPRLQAAGRDHLQRKQCGPSRIDEWPPLCANSRGRRKQLDASSRLTLVLPSHRLALCVAPPVVRVLDLHPAALAGDEFDLSAKQAAELTDEWRLAYVARLLATALQAYGVSPGTSPGRPPEPPWTAPPLDWNDWDTSPARLLRGLNDILYGVGPAPGA